MGFVKKLVCLLLVACLCVCLPVTASAQEDVTPYVQRMVQYYLHYQSGAETEINTILDHIGSVDPGQGILWRDIMDHWRWCNEEMPVNRDVLPDGLPQDDTLCIVTLGYGLKDDGSMKEELIDRLVVALASALKYPNAYVCVTGGPTAAGTDDTEAGQMYKWLVEKGLEPGRILVEDRSLSTVDNARNVFDLLYSRAPQVNSIAIVSSDYHIPWGVSLFTVMSDHAAYYNGRNMEIVGNAANTTGNNMDTLYSQALGICSLNGIPFDGNSVPAMYAPETTVETLPPADSEVIVEEADNSWMVAPVSLLGAALLVLMIPTKKRGKKK